MKKKYIQPTAKAVTVEITKILAGSVTLDSGGSNSGGGPTGAEGKQYMLTIGDDSEDI